MAIIKLDGGYNALPISYKRGNPIPLDTTAVWYDFAALEAYAKTGVTAYVGQVLTYVDSEKNTATAYVIANVAGDLEPIGTAPVGDGKTIKVDEETGKISILVDVNSDTDAGSVLTLQSDGTMKWVKPDNTTVEGLNLSVGALQKEVFGVVANEEAGVEAYTGLTDRVTKLEKDSIDLDGAIKTEAERAAAAEEALGKRIDAIDFVDEDELTAALAPYETTADVTNKLALKADKSVVDAMYANDKIDELVAGAKSYTDTEVAKKADKEAYEATVATLAEVKGKVEAFLDGTGAAEDVIDTLQDLIDFINTHDDVEISSILADIEALEKKLVLGTYKDGEEDKEYATVKAYVEAVVAALNVAQYAKAADVYSKTDADAKFVADADLGGKVDALVAECKGATGNQAYEDLSALVLQTWVNTEYITAINSNTGGILDQANTYTDTEVENLSTAVDGKLALKANAADVYTKSEIDEYTTANDAEIAALKDKDAAQDTAIANAITSAADDATGKAAQALADAKQFVTDSYKTAALTSEEITAAVNAEKTRAEGQENKIAGDLAALDGVVAGVSDTANQGVAAAGVAQAAANSAKSTADSALALAQANGATLTDHGTRIDALEAHDRAHTTEYNNLSAKVLANEGNITTLTNTKADSATVNGVIADVAALNLQINGKAAEGDNPKVDGLKDKIEANAADIIDLDGKVTVLEGKVDVAKVSAAIATAKEEAIGEADTKAKAAEDAAKGYADGIVDALSKGAVAENAQAIIDEAARADAAEKANAKAIADEIVRAKAVEEEFAGDIADLDSAIKAVLDNEGGALDSIKELATWVEEHETEVLPVIEQQGKDIAAIYTPASGDGEDAVAASGVLVDEIAAAKSYAESKANAAEANAKSYADGLADDYATAAQGALADTAVQSVTCAADMGIKATPTGTSIVLDWDPNVTLILCGGGAEIPEEE